MNEINCEAVFRKLFGLETSHSHCLYCANVKNMVHFGLLLMLLVSCATVPRSLRDRIVGEWRYADETMTCQYVLSSDGRFNGETTLRGRPLSKFTGLWSVEDKTVLYRYTADKLKRIPAGTIDRDKLLKVEKDSFTVEVADGSRRRYVRVR
jgi:hypothetical protein